MTDIGIIGAGIAGLHLGIKLVQEGFNASIYSPLSMRQIGQSRLMNSVSHQFDTILRERDMSIEHWTAENCPLNYGHFYSIDDGKSPALQFWGAFNHYARAVDYRLYLPQLMRDFELDGGRLIHTPVLPEKIETLYEKHDLLAIGVGKKQGGYTDFFPRIDALSIHNKPPRYICCGLFKGIQFPQPCSVTINISVPAGELIEIPIQSADGPLTALLFEHKNRLDTPETVTPETARQKKDLERAILERLQNHYPATCERVDTGIFSLAQLSDYFHGAFLPITRKCYAEIFDGKYAIAIGDLRTTMDPVTGQGANLASYNSCKLADHIADADGIFDRDFCLEYERATSQRVIGMVNFNNAILNPAPNLMKLFHEMSLNQKLADDFTRRFNCADTIWWDILRDNETTDRYLKGFKQDEVLRHRPGNIQRSNYQAQTQ